MTMIAILLSFMNCLVIRQGFGKQMRLTRLSIVQGVPKLMAVFEKFVDPQYKLFGMTYILKNHVRGHAWML